MFAVLREAQGFSSLWSGGQDFIEKDENGYVTRYSVQDGIPSNPASLSNSRYISTMNPHFDWDEAMCT